MSQMLMSAILREFLPTPEMGLNAFADYLAKSK
jgi:hypothetical protein